MRRLAALDLAGQLWKIYAVIGGASVLALCFLMPPFQVNDEFQHFFRSYQVSEGIGIGRAVGHVAGGFLPASLSTLVLGIVGSLQLYMVHPVVAEPLAATLKFLDLPLAAGSREFTDFSATVLYPPTGYLPQAAGICLARVLGLGPLGCFFAGRIANGMVAVAVTSFAIRIAPQGRFAFFLIGLLPTVLYLDASLSQDADIVASILLFLALCLQAHQRRQWATGAFLLATGSAIVFASSKFAFTPILLLAFAPCFAGARVRGPEWGRAAGIIALAMLCAIGWVVISHPLMVWNAWGNDATRQLHFIITHPLGFCLVLLDCLSKFWLLYIRSATSMFVGWYPELELPPAMFFLIIGGFFVLPLTGEPAGRPLRAGLRYLILALVPVIIFAVLSLIYLCYEPVGGSIDAVQGRHLIPVLPLLALFLATMEVATSRRVVLGVRLGLVGLGLLNAGSMIVMVCISYSLFSAAG